MNKILLCTLILLFRLFYASAQEKANVRFLLADEDSGEPVTSGNIILKILSDNYGIGDEHPFINGVCTIKYPTGQQLKYTVRSTAYYMQKGLMKEYNVIPGNANTVTIFLTPAGEKDLVIKGRVRNKSGNDLFGCRVQIDMEAAPGNRKVLTDSSGFFQFVFENGKKLIGTKFNLSITSNTCMPLDSTIFIEKKSINDLGELRLAQRTGPLKTGYIKFKGPERALESIVLRSDCFAADEIRPGYWRLTGKTNPMPAVAAFKVDCMDCTADSLSLPVSNVVDRIYEMDITPLVMFVPTTLTICLEGGYNYFLGHNMSQRTAASSKIGLASDFEIVGKWFGAAVKGDIWAGDVTASDKYITLPGNEGTALNSFTLKTLPLLQLRYYFGTPNGKLPIWYAGINGGFYHQTIKNVSADQSIEEQLQNLSFFAPGFNGGVRYNVSNLIRFCGELSMDYLKVTNVNYQFNYFGRADQSKFTSNQLRLNFNISMLYSL